METVLKIRRMHQVDGLAISAIANITGLSRNTVRKYLHQLALILMATEWWSTPLL